MTDVVRLVWGDSSLPFSGACYVVILDFEFIPLDSMIPVKRLVFLDSLFSYLISHIIFRQISAPTMVDSAGFPKTTV